MGGKEMKCCTNFLFNVHQDLRELVTICWSGNPEKRPNFEEIIVRLEGLLKGMPKHSSFTAGGGAGACCNVQ